MDTSDGRNDRLLRAPTPYARRIRALSDRLVEAQRPLRILDAVQWDDAVEWAFFERDARELPPVSPEYYSRRSLPFVPHVKLQEFQGIEGDIRRLLGVHDTPGQILTRMCTEYREAVSMLAYRGTRTFSEASRRLYGSATETLPGHERPLAEVGRQMVAALGDHRRPSPPAIEPQLDAGTSVTWLATRLKAYFGDVPVRVQLSDGIVADAAAGCDYIKLRRDAFFTASDLRVLEVHEGWVHLGTTLNGQRQPICTFLSKGPPSSTITQEGLAVLVEVLALAAHPGRTRRLVSRLEGVALAERGANFLEVYRFFLDEGCGRREAYQHTMRIFRGSLPEGLGPFTKDICYSKGFVLVSDFLRRSVATGGFARVPLLFCGKTCLADMDALAQLVEEGLVVPPRFVPEPFTELECATKGTTPPARVPERVLTLPQTLGRPSVGLLAPK